MESGPLSTKEIKKTIKDHIQQPYIDKFIDQPEIDEDKLFLLTSILYDAPYPDTWKKRFVVTSMLVQMALDTHDRVAEDGVAGEPDVRKKQRQLTVLAGDYYSGLYYYLLSRLGDVQMIRLLASVIKEVNEAKMHAYYEKFDTAGKFLDELEHIETLLIRRVAEEFGHAPISRFAESWLIRERLRKEKELHEKSGQSGLFQLLRNGTSVPVQEDDIPVMIEGFIEMFTERVKIRAGTLPDHFFMLRGEMSGNMENFFRSTIKAKEEG